MLSREELDEIREDVEGRGSFTYASDALEIIHVLLWHIDALEARQEPTQKLPKGARTLPDGSIRPGVPGRRNRNPITGRFIKPAKEA